MKNHGLIERFEDYLMTKPVTESFALTKEETLSFHWANWDQTCELWQKRSSSQEMYSGSFQKRREMFGKNLEAYKNVPAWIKTKMGLKKISVFELHESFQKGDFRFEQEGEESLVSLHSESGPYMSMSSMRWLDPEVNRYFIYNQIFNSAIKLRQFRMNANIPVLCRLDQMMMSKSMMHFHQFTEQGLILRISGKPLLDKVMNSRYIEFYFDFTPFKEAMNVGFEEAIGHLGKTQFNVFENDIKRSKFVLSTSTIERYQNKDNFKKTGGNQFYIFARFCDFNSADNLEHIFTDLTKKGESFFKEGLKKVA